MSTDVTSLQGRDISLSFGGLRVLKGLKVDFRPGQITGLIGPNGAGKTSLFNCLTGAYRPQEGTITYAGQALDGLSPAARAKQGIVRSFQTVALCPDLTVLENVMLGVARNYSSGWLNAFLPLPKGRQEFAEMQESARWALSELGLEGMAEQFPKQLPPGMQRLVEIARAIVGKPSVLLLDEPAAGLNNSETRDLMHTLRQVANPDLVMVVVEHDMDLVMSICDRIYVLNFGEIVACGDPSEVSSNPDVVRIYLGSDDE